MTLDRAVLQERLEQSKRDREEQWRLMAARSTMFTLQEEALKKRAMERQHEANERARRNEYLRFGVSPPDGSNVSLAFLLSVGWRIETDESGKRVLISPPRQEKKDDRSR